MNYLQLNSIITIFLFFLCYEFTVYIIISHCFKLKKKKWKVYLSGCLFSCFNAMVTSLSNYYLASGLIEETQTILLLNKLLLMIGELLIILFIINNLDIEWYKCYWLTIIVHIILAIPATYYTNNFFSRLNNRDFIKPVRLDSSMTYILCFLLLIISGYILILTFQYIKISDQVDKFPKFIWPFIYTIWFLLIIILPKNFSNTRYKYYPEPPKIMRYNTFFPLILAVTTILLIVIYFIINYTKQRYLKREIDLLKEQNNIQYQNYLLLQQKDSQIHKLYHDIGNHITTIKLLMDTDNSLEAKEYTETLVKEYKEMKKQHFCNNPIINAVLLQKLRLCDQNKISHTIDIKLPDVIEIRDIDLMSVFSNLLDNAIESCQKNILSDNYIKIATSTIGDYLSIKVINSKLNGNHIDKNIFSTSKKDKFLHGYGIKIIDEIVERYDGQKQYEDNGDEFSVFVLLKFNH